MANQRKKQDDKNLKLLREIVALGGNRQCFDCNQKGPTYVNMTIGSFVCTRCSGMLRGLTPPHRVKSISMATFTPDEIEFIRGKGNDECAKTWMGLWDPARIHTQDQRELMIEKYERKRYYLEPGSPLKSIPASNGKVNVNVPSPQNPKSIPPPSRLHIQNNNNNASDTTTSRQRSHQNDVQQFTPDIADVFSKFSGTTEMNTSNNGFGRDERSNNNLVINNGLYANNKEFVADFNTAKIFNATVNSQNGSEFGNITSPNASNTGATKSTTENFADFEHNQIYNAAGLPMSTSSTSNSLYSNGTLNSSTATSTPSADRYAALKDLDEQFRESKENQSMTINNQQPQPSMNSANPFKTNGTFSPNPFHSQPAMNQSNQINWSNVQQPMVNFNGTSSMTNDDPFNTSALSLNPPMNFGTAPNMYNGGYMQPNPFNGIKASQNNPFL